MPIRPSLALQRVTQDEFARLDYQVMGHAYESQNELGRLCDETIYQNDLAARLTAAGLGPIRTEAPVVVSHGTFTRTYYLDLLVADAAIYELKTVTALTGEHEAQALNYLLLHDVQHGKLVNFRPPQVASRFVNTGLTSELRHRLEFNTDRWQEPDPASKAVREAICGLLADWGGFLEASLYTDALVHLLGGEQNVLQKVPLSRNGIPLGNQVLHLAAPGIAFRLTAMTNDVEAYERQLRSLLEHTQLRVLHWINLDHHNVALVTLTKGS